MLPFLAKESLSLQTSVNTKTLKGGRKKECNKKSKATKTEKSGKKNCGQKSAKQTYSGIKTRTNKNITYGLLSVSLLLEKKN